MILETLGEFCFEHTFVPVLKNDRDGPWLIGGEDLLEEAVIGGDIAICYGGVHMVLVYCGLVKCVGIPMTRRIHGHVHEHGHIDERQRQAGVALLSHSQLFDDGRVSKMEVKEAFFKVAEVITESCRKFRSRRWDGVSLLTTEPRLTLRGNRASTKAASP
jgi:hypothetical protein